MIGVNLTSADPIVCHPFCESNPVQRWPGPDAHDEIHYRSGLVYVRQFHDWVEGSGYGLEIGRRDGGLPSSAGASTRSRPIRAR